MALAVLFDFNGVLVDDEDVHFEAFRRTLAVLGVTISHDVYRRYLGYDDRGTIVALLDHYDRRAALDDSGGGRHDHPARWLPPPARRCLSRARRSPGRRRGG